MKTIEVESGQLKYKVGKILSELSDEIEFVITRFGKPVAKITKMDSNKNPKLGIWRDKKILPKDWDSNAVNTDIAELMLKAKKRTK